jgi:hypothetical protein
LIEGLKRYADATLCLRSREQLFQATAEQQRVLCGQLKAAFAAVPAFAAELGMDARLPFEVQELRAAMRVGPDGNFAPQAIVALTQGETVQAPDVPRYTFSGGSTIVIDLANLTVKYRIFKNINSSERRSRTAAFLRDASSDARRALLLAPGEPFAALHAFVEEHGV